MQVVSSRFGALRSWIACRNPKSQKQLLKPCILGGSGSFKLIDVDISKKLVVSAYNDRSHVCAHLQPFSR